MQALYYEDSNHIGRDWLNDSVLPLFQAHDRRLLRILTDRGTEYCGKVEQQDDELDLGLNDIEHTKKKAYSPQTNGICERFHRTILEEFYQIALRKKYINHLTSYKKIEMTGLIFIIITEHIREKCAAVAHQCKLCLMVKKSGRKKLTVST